MALIHRVRVLQLIVDLFVDWSFYISWFGVPRELRLELPRHIATRSRRRRSNRPIAPAAGVWSPRLSQKGPSTNWGRRPVGGGGRSCPGRVVAAPIAHRSRRMWPAGRLSSHGRETGGTGRDKSSKIRGAAGDAVHLGTHVWCGDPGRPCPHPRTCCLRLAAQLCVCGDVYLTLPYFSPIPVFRLRTSPSEPTEV